MLSRSMDIFYDHESNNRYQPAGLVAHNLRSLSKSKDITNITFLNG